MEVKNFVDIIRDIFSNDYLVKKEYREWYRLGKYENEIKKYIEETFGYEVSITKEIVRLERYSLIKDRTKGIKSFRSKDEYIIFPLVLNFLEGIPKDDSILIADIAEHVINNFPERRDWKDRKLNYKLVNVLRYCQDNHLIKKLDGSEERYERSGDPVLYENTGLSKIFMKHLPYYLDEKHELDNINLEGLSKIQILRRGLMENFIITKDFPYFEELEDFRDELEIIFDEVFNLRVVIFKELAYLLRDENSVGISKNFPSPNKNLERISLKFFKLLKMNKYSFDELLEVFKDYKKVYRSNFKKINLNKKEESLVEEVIELGESLNILSVEEGVEEGTSKIKKWIKMGEYIDHYTLDTLNKDEIKGEADEEKVEDR